MRKLRGQITFFNGASMPTESKIKYKKNMVLDVRVGNDNEIPDRIKITGSYIDGGKVKYHIICESNLNHDNFSVTEEYIDSILSHKYKKRRASVYDKEIIRLRYADGWRFVANKDFEECKDIVRKLKVRFEGRISGIRITEAYGPSGSMCTDGKTAVWIKYNRQLDGDEFDPNSVNNNIVDIDDINKPDGRFTIDILGEIHY